MRTARLVQFVALALVSAGGALPQSRDTLVQTSTIDALLQGTYDGEMTFAQLRKFGDFGIGTLNGVDGEMIALNGRFFQIASDGKARRVPDTARTPFASVTHFSPDTQIAVTTPLTLDELEKKIDAALRGLNYFYAIRVTGRFDTVKTRSVPKQHPPYVPLTEVVKTQPTFDLKDAEGTLVGFRCPEFAKAINVPGYHVHFLSKDEKAGGHVLSGILREGRIEIARKADFRLLLPLTPAFANADLVRDRTRDVRAVEK